MAKSQHLSHVAMSVPPGTLTDEWRKQVLDFYGELFGWTEMDSLRLPDRLTIAVGASYINVRERADAPAYNGYEHFGVVFRSSDEIRVRDEPRAIPPAVTAVIPVVVRHQTTGAECRDGKHQARFQNSSIH